MQVRSAIYPNEWQAYQAQIDIKLAPNSIKYLRSLRSVPISDIFDQVYTGEIKKRGIPDESNIKKVLHPNKINLAYVRLKTTQKYRWK